MKLKVLLCGLLLVTALPAPLRAQAAPRLVRFTGVVRDGQGQPLANVLTTMTFAIYRESEGGTPLWVESQAASLDVPLHALLELSLPTYHPDACPLCAQEVPISKPGSRQVAVDLRLEGDLEADRQFRTTLRADLAVDGEAQQYEYAGPDPGRRLWAYSGSRRVRFVDVPRPGGDRHE